jgi:hypothetical protein
VPGKGDPFQEANDYCLAGTYFERPLKDHPYTRTVRFKSGYTSGRLIFALSCRDSFYVDRISGKEHTADRDEGDRVVAEMRRKIAGILVEKQLGEQGIAVNQDGELILAIVQATARQQSDPQINAPEGTQAGAAAASKPSATGQARHRRDSSGRFAPRKEE